MAPTAKPKHRRILAAKEAATTAAEEGNAHNNNTKDPNPHSPPIETAHSSSSSLTAEEDDKNHNNKATPKQPQQQQRASPASSSSDNVQVVQVVQAPPPSSREAAKMDQTQNQALQSAATSANKASSSPATSLSSSNGSGPAMEFGDDKDDRDDNAGVVLLTQPQLAASPKQQHYHHKYDESDSPSTFSPPVSQKAAPTGQETSEQQPPPSPPVPPPPSVLAQSPLDGNDDAEADISSSSLSAVAAEVDGNNQKEIAETETPDDNNKREETNPEKTTMDETGMKGNDREPNNNNNNNNNNVTAEALPIALLSQRMLNQLEDEARNKRVGSPTSSASSQPPPPPPPAEDENNGNDLDNEDREREEQSSLPKREKEKVDDTTATNHVPPPTPEPPSRPRTRGGYRRSLQYIHMELQPKYHSSSSSSSVGSPSTSKEGQQPQQKSTKRARSNNKKSKATSKTTTTTNPKPKPKAESTSTTAKTTKPTACMDTASAAHRPKDAPENKEEDDPTKNPQCKDTFPKTKTTKSSPLETSFENNNRLNRSNDAYNKTHGGEALHKLNERHQHDDTNQGEHPSQNDNRESAQGSHTTKNTTKTTATDEPTQSDQKNDTRVSLSPRKRRNRDGDLVMDSLAQRKQPPNNEPGYDKTKHTSSSPESSFLSSPPLVGRRRSRSNSPEKKKAKPSLSPSTISSPSVLANNDNDDENDPALLSFPSSSLDADDSPFDENKDNHDVSLSHKKAKKRRTSPRTQASEEQYAAATTAAAGAIAAPVRPSPPPQDMGALLQPPEQRERRRSSLESHEALQQQDEDEAKLSPRRLALRKHAKRGNDYKNYPSVSSSQPPMAFLALAEAAQEMQVSKQKKQPNYQSKAPAPLDVSFASQQPNNNDKDDEPITPYSLYLKHQLAKFQQQSKSKNATGSRPTLDERDVAGQWARMSPRQRKLWHQRAQQARKEQQRAAGYFPTTEGDDDDGSSSPTVSEPKRRTVSVKARKRQETSSETSVLARNVESGDVNNSSEGTKPEEATDATNDAGNMASDGSDSKRGPSSQLSRPPTAFELFQNQYLPHLKMQFPNLDHPKYVAQMTHDWKTKLGPAEKQVFVDSEKKLKQKYLRELEQQHAREQNRPVPRPAGRAPKGKIWDSRQGMWVDEDDTNRRLKLHKRPSGRAPMGKTWNAFLGEWVDDPEQRQPVLASKKGTKKDEKEEEETTNIGVCQDDRTGNDKELLSWDRKRAPQELKEFSIDSQGSSEYFEEEGTNQSLKRFTRPPGRAPKGKKWDYSVGEWITIPQEELEKEESSAEPSSPEEFEVLPKARSMRQRSPSPIQQDPCSLSKPNESKTELDKRIKKLESLRRQGDTNQDGNELDPSLLATSTTLANATRSTQPKFVRTMRWDVERGVWTDQLSQLPKNLAAGGETETSALSTHHFELKAEQDGRVSDGCILPWQILERLPDFTFLQPENPGPDGFWWDAVRGLWKLNAYPLFVPCGQCVACQVKQPCGNCLSCRNDKKRNNKSRNHCRMQICKTPLQRSGGKEDA